MRIFFISIVIVRRDVEVLVIIDHDQFSARLVLKTVDRREEWMERASFRFHLRFDKRSDKWCPRRCFSNAGPCNRRHEQNAIHCHWRTVRVDRSRRRWSESSDDRADRIGPRFDPTWRHRCELQDEVLMIVERRRRLTFHDLRFDDDDSTLLIDADRSRTFQIVAESTDKLSVTIEDLDHRAGRALNHHQLKFKILRCCKKSVLASY